MYALLKKLKVNNFRVKNQSNNLLIKYELFSLEFHF